MDQTIIRALIAQEFVPSDAPTFGKVVLIPGLLAILGIIVFAALFQRSLSKKDDSPLRHVGTVLIAAGLVVSLLRFSRLTNKDTGTLYREAIVSQYTLIAHYAVPALLLVLLLAIGAAEVYLNKARLG